MPLIAPVETVHEKEEDVVAEKVDGSGVEPTSIGKDAYKVPKK